ncbi:MAG: DUF934 domain-containing protein [Pseudomonadota bacterium]
MQIIKDNEIVKDHWTHIADDPIPPEGRITVSYARWKAEKSDLLARDGELGIRLSPEDPIEDVASDLENFQLVALEFPAFTDGRGFSQARLLRDRYAYSGEIRAIGDFMVDQVFYLSRVGVNAFELPTTEALEKALASLRDFTVRYQASTDEPLPLIQRLRGQLS